MAGRLVFVSGVCLFRALETNPQSGHRNSMKNKKNKTKAMTESAGSSVARVTEIIASSATSFEDALAVGVARACKTLEGVTGAWVQDQKIDVKDGKITNYRVNLKVTFVLKD